MRPRHEVLALLRAIVEDVTNKPVRELAPEMAIADLGDLGIDSVSLADIVARIEENLACEVPASQWVRVRTVQDLVDVVNQGTPS
jgi:acyl carrier protein